MCSKFWSQTLLSRKPLKTTPSKQRCSPFKASGAAVAAVGVLRTTVQRLIGEGGSLRPDPSGQDAQISHQ